MRLAKHAMRSLIRDCTIQAIRARAEAAFISSQQRCPVRTGKLKRSGNIINLEEGTQIQYTAPYASYVERGTRGGMVTVKPHMRAGKSIQSYTYFASPREGRKFISDSMMEAFADLSSAMNQQLCFHFRDVKKVV